MRFMRLGPLGQERPVLLGSDGRHYDLSSITPDINGEFLTRLADGLNIPIADLPEIVFTELRVGAPIARPHAVLCVGQNYAAHARESGSEPPEVPIVFYKAPNTVVGPNDDVLIPPGSSKTDWEVELGVVIGKRARYLSTPAEAARHVAGFVTSNDVSERDFQLAQSGGQWSKGKSCETFNPLGPMLVTADEVVNPQDLRLTSHVNGDVRQDSSTSDMIFSVLDLVCHLSNYTVLEAGDLINTGTPQGVALSNRFPYLRHGDVVEVEVSGLGRQRSTLRSA